MSQYAIKYLELIAKGFKMIGVKEKILGAKLVWDRKFSDFWTQNEILYDFLKKNALICTKLIVFWGKPMRENFLDRF